MATIKAIEAKSVHQIQSGQVIVDLCSVAKELVENSLDAGATAVEVRFKNHGLDSIEVQDNGSGISPENYDSLALKHYTSKLSNYDDLSNLQSFGFRGEALSSLCALSTFSVITAQVDEAPKGKRLDFDISGKLKTKTVVAAQKGTTACVENLFESLPVRRRELAKNVKREYGKVLGLLQAYACICVNVKFTVKHAIPKGKSMTVFSTKGNATTRENIANVYGAKTLSALAPLDLDLEFQSTLTQMMRKDTGQTAIHVRGHISKPVFGEGRQTPDRQMFFVNGRPCGLPQIAKAINEVYKAFNVSQSPFIFADLQMDTNAYDVNVSPDKRTILLHDSATLIENLKTALNEMFEQQDQTVPQTQVQAPRIPVSQKLSFPRQSSSMSSDVENGRASRSDQSPVPQEKLDESDEDMDQDNSANSLFRQHFQNFTSTRDETEVDGTNHEKLRIARERRAGKIAQNVANLAKLTEQRRASEDVELSEDEEDDSVQLSKSYSANLGEGDFDGRSRHEPSQGDDDQAEATPELEPEITSTARSRDEENKGAVPNAFDRMRPKRMPAELATVTIGDKTITTILGTQFPESPIRRQQHNGPSSTASAQHDQKSGATRLFSQRLRKFGAPEADISDEEDHQEIPGQNVATQSDSDLNEEEDSPRVPEMEDESGDDKSNSAIDADSDSDGDYLDEQEKKKAEEAKVAELIRAAEESSSIPSKENLKRATKTLAGGRTKDSTADLLTILEYSALSVEHQMRRHLDLAKEAIAQADSQAVDDNATSPDDAETRLSLTVSKVDFARMDVVGQFNLGFILAVRPAHLESQDTTQSRQDELFIIDQHASDEKYNFERLQAETVVGNQRLVRPVTLDLTAVEEEIVLENNEALEKNGFLVEIDTSGERMVGQRCSLVSLPLSKEVVFNTRDLEELIQLLAESPGLGSGNESGIPRPSKVRKMFAMRACRSSIMIGKTLSKKQMERVVTHMGTIDKPWNCPHGRPTMRHLCSLNTLQPWREGEDEHGEEQVGLGERLHGYVAEEE